MFLSTADDIELFDEIKRLPSKMMILKPSYSLTKRGAYSPIIWACQAKLQSSGFSTEAPKPYDEIPSPPGKFLSTLDVKKISDQ
jgi:hypothetical protein